MIEDVSFLHVGLPKCGSSFLEKRYFVPANGFYNLANQDSWTHYIDYQLLTAQSTYYRSACPPLPEIPIMSDTMIGISNSAFLTGVDYELALRRWKVIAPRAKILIVIRNQLDQVYSGYGQRVLSGYYRSIDEYIRELIWDAQSSSWGRLFYDKIFDISKEYYDDVLVMPLERMKESDSYIKELNKYFEVVNSASSETIRPSLNHSTITLIRTCNRLFKHGLGLPRMAIMPSYEGGVKRFQVNRVPGIEPTVWKRRLINRLAKSVGQRLPKHTKNKDTFEVKYKDLFFEWFQESNQRLEEKTGLPLGHYGFVGAKNYKD